MCGLGFWFEIQEYPGQAGAGCQEGHDSDIGFVSNHSIPFETQWDGGWWVMGWCNGLKT